MNEFDLDHDPGDDYSDLPGYNPDGTPDYDSATVSISTELRLNGDGTVTITYRHVPILDVVDLLVQQGSEDGVLAMLQTLGDLLDEQLYRFRGDLV